MTGATLAVITFAAWSLAFNYLSHRYSPARRVLEGEPVVLVRDGTCLKRNMNRERIDSDELASEMRLAGVSRIEQVAWAILEPEGKISFIRKDEGETDTRANDDGPAG